MIRVVFVGACAMLVACGAMRPPPLAEVVEDRCTDEGERILERAGEDYDRAERDLRALHARCLLALRALQAIEDAPAVASEADAAGL